MVFFADMDILGFAVNKESQKVTLQVDAHFSNSNSSQNAKDTISGVISLYRGMLQTPELKDLLGKVEVTTSDSWLTMALGTTVSEIKTLVETFRK